MRIQRLIIGINKSKDFPVWREVFRHHDDVNLLSVTNKDLHTVEGLDVELMTWLLVHEKFGGTPLIDKSQVISTGGEKGLPSWFVTTPTKRALGEWRPASDGTLTWHDLSDPWGEKDVLWVFRSAFKAVDEFNRIQKEPLRSLGFSTNSLFFTQDPNIDAPAVEKAWSDYKDFHLRNF